MRRRNALVAASVLIASLTSTPPLSAQSGAVITAELAYKSKYLFAGIPFAADDVMQARVAAGIGSLTLNAFSVYDLEASDVTEADVYGDYYIQLGQAVGLFVGGALYNFKLVDGWEATPEAYGGLVFTAPLNPVLYAAHDFDLGDGTHVTLMLSHGVPIGENGVTLGLAGNLDYNDGYYSSVSGLAYADARISLAIPAGPLTITPMAVVQRLIDDAFREGAFIDDEELFGISVAFTF